MAKKARDYHFIIENIAKKNITIVICGGVDVTHILVKYECVFLTF